MSRVGPVDHLPRVPLPWRDTADLTECGKQLDELPAERVTSVEEVQRRIRDEGRQRASYSLCMTCLDTAERWHSAGDRNGLGALGRELENVRWAHQLVGHPGRHPAHTESDRRLWERRERLVHEIEALAALVREHPEEFAGYLADRAEAVSLDDARQARQLRRIARGRG